MEGGEVMQEREREVIFLTEERMRERGTHRRGREPGHAPRTGLGRTAGRTDYPLLALACF